MLICGLLVGCSNDRDNRNLPPRAGRGASSLGQAAAKSKNPKVFLVVVVLGLLKTCPILIPVAGYAYWKHSKNKKEELVTQRVQERAPPLKNTQEAVSEHTSHCQKCSAQIKEKLIGDSSVHCPACGHLNAEEVNSGGSLDDYYYLDEEHQIHGPFKMAELKEKLKESIISNQTLAARDGEESWQLIADIKKLS